MGYRRILIVDDLDAMSRLLTDIFEREGYDVQTAANGWQALDAIADASFDLILVNLDLPLVGGREFAQGLRRRFVRTPIIGISSGPTRLEGESGLAVAAVIGKPLPLATLINLVDDVIQGAGKVVMPNRPPDHPT